MMIPWEITHPMKRTALAAAGATHRNLKRTPNYTGLESEDRFYHGFLGELIVEAWLTAEDVKHAYVMDTSGKSRGADFYIDIPDSRRFRLEVKTASKSNHHHLMMPIEQYYRTRQKWDVIAGLKLDLTLDKGFIMGCCSRDVFDVAPVGTFGRYEIDSKYIPFDQLAEPECILRLARTGVPHA